jgi:hypothetical protein
MTHSQVCIESACVSQMKSNGIDSFRDRVVPHHGLLRRGLDEDLRVGHRRRDLGLHPRLEAPARLADPEAVDQPVLGDRLEDRLVVDLLLLRVDDDLHVPDAPVGGLVAGHDDHPRPVGDHPRHDRLDRRVAERNEQFRAPCLLRLVDHLVAVAGVLGPAAEIGEAAVQAVELLGLAAEAGVLGFGLAEAVRDECHLPLLNVRKLGHPRHLGSPPRRASGSHLGTKLS